MSIILNFSMQKNLKDRKINVSQQSKRLELKYLDNFRCFETNLINITISRCSE